MANSERRIGTIRGFERWNFDVNYFDLILTDARIIICKTGSASLLLTYCFTWIYFFISLRNRVRTSRRLCQQSISSLVSDSNSHIEIEKISGIKLKKSFAGLGGKITIYHSNKELTFDLCGEKTAILSEKTFGQYKQMLMNTMPEKIR
jgi:hypothetical protein